MRRLLGGVTLALMVVGWVAMPTMARANVVEIPSGGPLINIAVSSELNCQVGHVGDANFEFFDGLDTIGACATILSVDGKQYGPSQIPAGPTTLAPWTPVSQSGVTGDGTDANPFTVTTVVSAGPSVRVTEIDSYVAGLESYRTDLRLDNTAGAAISGVLFRAGDCYLQNSDSGIGRIDSGAPACIASTAPNARIEQWLPLTPGSRAYAGPYDVNWNLVLAQQPYPDRCDCDSPVDDGAGISWSYSLQPGESATFSHLTLFSPAGKRPAITTLSTDNAAPSAGTIVHFAAQVQNPATTPLELSALHADLAPGFQYVSGSTTGVTSNDPAIGGTRLTWPGPYTIPAGGQLAFTFATRAGGTATSATVTAGADPSDPTVTTTDGSVAVSVTGGTAVEQPLRTSVPSPLQVNLSPQVIAQTAVLAVGVVVLIPFPSALFNSTLEQNYDEIIEGGRRLRARLLGPLRRRTGRPNATDVAADPLAVEIRPAAELDPALAPAALAEPAAAPDQASIEEKPKRRRSRSRASLGEAAAAGAAERTVEIENAVPATDDVTVTVVSASEPVSELEMARPAEAIDLGIGFWATIPGIVAFLVVSALLYDLLDPTFGFNLHSLSTFLGVLAGLSGLLIAFGLAFEREMRNRFVFVMPRALPGTIVIGVACVLVSRLASFQPGYLYGLVVGFLLSRELSKVEEGRAMGVATGAALVATFAAWLLLVAVRAAEPATGDPPLFMASAETACVTLTTAGIEMALFAMLPLRFMPGEAVWRWNHLAWCILVGLGSFGFFLILVNPQSGYLADSSRNSLFTMVLLLGGFALASVAFWAYFRYRNQPAGAEPPSEEAIL